jgi:hypothetical protein
MWDKGEFSTGRTSGVNEQHENHEEWREWLSRFGEMGPGWLKYGTVAAGGFALLLYTNQIGHFPEGIQLGEGLAFYLLSFGLLLIYGLYCIGVTALGAVLVRWPGQWLYHLTSKRGTNRRHSPVNVDFGWLWSGPFWGGSVMGAGILIALSHEHPLDLPIHILVCLMQGTALIVLLMTRRRSQSLSVGLLVPLDSAGERGQLDLRTMKLASLVVLCFMFVGPMMFAPRQTAFVTAAFRFAKLRQDDAEVHVKQPWSRRLLDAGQRSSNSFLGADYLRFEHVKVLLKSFGSKVVVELPDGKDRVKRIEIPAEALYIE